MFESCRAHSEQAVVLVLRSATIVVALLFVLAGCGGGEEGETPSAETALEIKVWPNGKDRATAREWRLQCDPAEGTHPAPEEACEQLFDLDDPFAPPPPDAVCAELYGGPGVAEVEGLFRGETVNARFSRTDGCEIGRWNRHAFLFPVKPGSPP